MANSKLFKLYNSALNFVNEVRSAYKLKPLYALPKGRKQSSSSCPIAVATGATKVGNRELRKPGLVWELPSEVTEFIQEFDRGSYPDLARR